MNRLNIKAFIWRIRHLLLLVIMINMTACGVPSSKYDEAIRQNDSLLSKHAELHAQVEELERDIAILNDSLEGINERNMWNTRMLVNNMNRSKYNSREIMASPAPNPRKEMERRATNCLNRNFNQQFGPRFYKNLHCERDASGMIKASIMEGMVVGGTADTMWRSRVYLIDPYSCTLHSQ